MPRGGIPYCKNTINTDVVGVDASAGVIDTTITAEDTIVTPVDTSVAPEDFSMEFFSLCGGGSPYIKKFVRNHGGWGTVVIVKGSDFEVQQSLVLDSQEGYYSFVAFASNELTMIATDYFRFNNYERPWWSPFKVKTKFKKLFIDSDGDYLQGTNEPLLTKTEVPFGDYDVTFHTIWFEDLNSNGVYDSEDTIYDFQSSGSQTFTFNDEPTIHGLFPAEISHLPETVVIRGQNFGETQGESILLIGGETRTVGHPNIKKWNNHKIKIRVKKLPKYSRLMGVSIVVDGKKSNKRKIDFGDYIDKYL